ncbi:hypothetical protein DH2020_032128 [Rehmannia glutinosa]|uniref:BHLH domain-containing protein n=1 Tax=Rehmannia glutinosa TaxID=99300 RepID=A0ABR0VG55_REHGL
MENFNMNTVNHGIMHDGFSDHHQNQSHQLPMAFDDEIPRSIGPNLPIFDPMVTFFPSGHGCNNIMNNMVHEHEIQVNLSPSVSGTGFVGTNNKVNKKHLGENYGGKKRKRISEREIEKPREVVHVRAKRGQATDSHSLAERLRREKINDKLRCLQDLVPGCYKTMGMAVMLDVIINYVRSLQNQIDFLSMKLSAASLFYDFNSSEAEAMESVQEDQEMESGGEKKKVMVAIDESDCSHYALEWTLQNLRETLENSKLVIFTAQPVADYAVELVRSVQENHKRIAEALLDKAKDICSHHGVAADTFTEIGDPKDAICGAVEKLNIQLLVLGSHGRKALQRSMKDKYVGAKVDEGKVEEVKEPEDWDKEPEASAVGKSKVTHVTKSLNQAGWLMGLTSSEVPSLPSLPSPAARIGQFLLRPPAIDDQ